MSCAEIKEVVSRKFPGAAVDVSDISGSEKYYRVTIESCIFNNMTELEKQRCFYARVWKDIEKMVVGVTLVLVGNLYETGRGF